MCIRDRGIIDGVGNLTETLGFIGEMKLVGKPEKGVYGALKREMWRETVRYLEDQAEESQRDLAVRVAQARETAERERRVGEWERAKL